MSPTRPAAQRLDALLARSPLQAVFDRRSGSRLAVLAYHHTPDRTAFARQMDVVRDRFRPVDLDSVLDALGEHRPLPPRAALITFDDADPSILEVARPVLEERAIPAVAFVVTSLLGTERPFWWEEVEELVAAGGTIQRWGPLSGPETVRRLKTLDDALRLELVDGLRATASRPAAPRPQLRPEELRLLEASGIAVGNHTATHPCLPRCTGEQIDREVRGAHAALSDALGHEPRAFAYPNGDQDPRVVAAVAGAGYRAAFLFDHRPCRWPPADPLRISRLRTNAQASPDRFRLILSGLHPFLHHAVGRS